MNDRLGLSSEHISTTERTQHGVCDHSVARGPPSSTSVSGLSELQYLSPCQWPWIDPSTILWAFGGTPSSLCVEPKLVGERVHIASYSSRYHISWTSNRSMTSAEHDALLDRSSQWSTFPRIVCWLANGSACISVLRRGMTWRCVRPLTRARQPPVQRVAFRKPLAPPRRCSSAVPPSSYHPSSYILYSRSRPDDRCRVVHLTLISHLSALEPDHSGRRIAKWPSHERKRSMSMITGTSSQRTCG